LMNSAWAMGVRVTPEKKHERLIPNAIPGTVAARHAHRSTVREELFRAPLIATIACQSAAPIANRQNATTGPGDPDDFANVDPSDSPTKATRIALTPRLAAERAGRSPRSMTALTDIRSTLVISTLRY